HTRFSRDCSSDVCSSDLSSALVVRRRTADARELLLHARVRVLRMTLLIEEALPRGVLLTPRRASLLEHGAKRDESVSECALPSLDRKSVVEEKRGEHAGR